MREAGLARDSGITAFLISCYNADTLMSTVSRSRRSKGKLPPEPVTSLPGTGNRASKRARRTPQAAEEAAAQTPERRVLDQVFVLDNPFVAKAVGRLSHQDIKDVV